VLKTLCFKKEVCCIYRAVLSFAEANQFQKAQWFLYGHMYFVCVYVCVCYEGYSSEIIILLALCDNFSEMKRHYKKQKQHKGDVQRRAVHKKVQFSNQHSHSIRYLFKGKIHSEHGFNILCYISQK
jgi:hypothetical protein